MKEEHDWRKEGKVTSDYNKSKRREANDFNSNLMNFKKANAMMKKSDSKRRNWKSKGERVQAD